MVHTRSKLRAFFRVALWLTAFVLLGITVVIAFAWYNRDSVVPPLLNAYSGPAYGVEIARLEGMDWQRGSLQLEFLELVMVSSGLNVQISDLVALVDLDQLSLTELEVATLQLRKTPVADAGSAAPLLVADLVDSLFSLPLKNAQINGISLGAAFPAVDLTWTATENQRLLRMTADTGEELQLSISAEYRFEGNVSLPEVGRLLNFELKPDKLAYRLDAGATLTDPDLRVLMSRYLAEPLPLGAAFESLSVQVTAGLDTDLNKILELNWPLKITTSGLLRVEDPLTDTPPAQFARLGFEGDVVGHMVPIPTIDLDSSGLTMSGTNEDLGRRLEAAFHDGSCQLIESDPHCNLEFVGNLTMLEWADEELVVSDIGLQTEGLLDLRGPLLSAELREGTSVAADAITLGSTTAQSVQLTSTSTATLNYDMNSALFSMEGFAGQLDLPRIEDDDWAMTGILEFSEGEWNGEIGSLQFHSDYWNIQSPHTWLPVLSLGGVVSLEQDVVGVNGELASYRGDKLLSLLAQHDLEAASGQIFLDTGNLNFSVGGDTLGDRFDSWPYEWDLENGAASMQAELAWNMKEGVTSLTGESEGQLESVDISYGDVAAFGLSGSAHLLHTGIDQIVTADAIQLRISALDIGARIEDISAAVNFDSGLGSWSVTAVRASMLGGVVSCEVCTYEQNRLDNTLTIKAQGVLLEKILALAESGAVEGSGVIDGKFPLLLSAEGVTMVDGNLSARAPGGVIRYIPDSAPEDGASDNEALDLVTRALENYQYDSLGATASYNQAGDLNLQMRVEGFNPDLYDGQRIHLNLNLSDNIPSLLRSLQAGREVSDLIEQQLE